MLNSGQNLFSCGSKVIKLFLPLRVIQILNVVLFFKYTVLNFYTFDTDSTKSSNGNKKLILFCARFCSYLFMHYEINDR
jgi:hypothetical protein